MREDLAREFPEAVRAAGWTRAQIGGRRPMLFNEPVAWAALSGIGAGFLVGAVAQALVSVTSEAMQMVRSPQPFALFPLVTIAGSAAAAAVALRAGGPVALLFDLMYVALGIGLAIPGRVAFCERSGGVFPGPGPDQCSSLGFVTSLWPQLIGIGLGIAIARGL